MAGDVAETILAQLGGARRLSAMVGACDFTDFGPGLRFRIKARALRAVNWIEVELHPSDTYIVRFIRSHYPLRIVVSEHRDVYVDTLRGLIERETGLALSL